MPEYGTIFFWSEGGPVRIVVDIQVIAVSKWLRRDERTTADLVRGLIAEGIPQRFANLAGAVLIRRLQSQGAIRLEQGGARWSWTLERKPWE